ncbi:MAG: hypothetical protein KDJ31_17795 [Candidatus Competibacteraceae bacterium]|nr:hypothetical protein [Candidatus Competibacteraceae bacterium]MCB1820389.1 hypothetical protein [Candidatus Competibacteraceae bacterium]
MHVQTDRWLNRDQASAETALAPYPPATRRRPLRVDIMDAPTLRDVGRRRTFRSRS